MLEDNYISPSQNTFRSQQFRNTNAEMQMNNCFVDRQRIFDGDENIRNHHSAFISVPSDLHFGASIYICCIIPECVLSSFFRLRIMFTVCFRCHYSQL